MTNYKILCIGNETSNTDDMVSAIAKEAGSINHGLISHGEFYPEHPGYYHTTISDVPSGDIVLNLAKHFDLIKMVDQDIDSYPHFKSFVNTFRLMVELEKTGFSTEFRDNAGNKDILYWSNLIASNKSICAYPFVTMSNDYGWAMLCCKNDKAPITKIKDITDWSTDPSFEPVRSKMLDGIKMPETCALCYEREDNGGESPRQFETLEWAMDLRLKDKQDLRNIKNPVCYDIRPTNKCNIMCRMCDDRHSHLIEEENKKIGFPIITDQWRMQPFPLEKIDWPTAKRIYWAGGEPTVMPEFYAFLRSAIKQNQVDFDLNIGSNALKISDTLLDLLQEFPRVTFSVSVDGYKQVNDYIRWGSKFDVIRENCFRILERGHTLAFQTVFSMYNATRIHEIFEFYDRDFPGCNTLVQPANNVDSHLSPWHNPLKEQVLESMLRCKETKVCYNNGRNTNKLVDEMIGRYENYTHNPKWLREFFEYNDKLDQSRNSRLIDYIPELAETRHKFCQ